MVDPISVITTKLRKKLESTPIAFFSAEYALEDNLPIYAGGLGVLAGDFLLGAAHESLPVVAIGLFYRNGFETFRSGSAPHAALDPVSSGFTLLTDEAGTALKLEVELDNRRVAIQAWTKTYNTVRLFLLDTNVKPNSFSDRAITAFLYPAEFRIKLLQEIIFGIGGIKLLRYLGIFPAVYHLNEGHAGFVALALVIEYLHDHPDEKNFEAALQKTKHLIVATKHTVLPESGLFFTRNDFQGTLDAYLSRHNVKFEDFCALGQFEQNPELFSMTRFLLKSAIRANGVSHLHAFFEKQIHAQSELFPITNAIDQKRWLSPLLAGKNPSTLAGQELWNLRARQRQILLGFLQQKTNITLNPEALTMVWARRFAAYKRPGILFNDLKRLEKLLFPKNRPVQVIIAGQPNVADEDGVKLLKHLAAYTQLSAFKNKVICLPEYSLAIARELVRGADLWLNTSVRGKEASGTSGMKSALNGGLQFTTSDGWADEVDWGDKGWVLPESNPEAALYDMLDQEIVPLFFERDGAGLPQNWISRMRRSMQFVSENYTTRRMLQEYLSKLYFPV